MSLSTVLGEHWPIALLVFAVLTAVVWDITR